MFTRAGAQALRAQLPALDFHVQASRPALLEDYLAHYGLKFADTHAAVTHRVGVFQSSEFTLVAQYWALPDSEQRGTAFLLHGYFDHTGLYGHLIRHCLEQGYAVVILDLPGHGLSSGPSAHIDSFSRYSEAFIDCLELAEEQAVKEPWILLAQSTGAAVTMDALLGHELGERFNFRRYILLGPLLRPLRWQRTRLLFAVSRWFLRAIPRRYSDNSHDHEFLTFLRANDPLQSQYIPHDWVVAMMQYQRRFGRAKTQQQVLHIIQGSGDGTVDWHYNLPRILEKFPGSKSYIITNARHHLVNESSEYRGKVFDLISQIIGPDRHSSG